MNPFPHLLVTALLLPALALFACGKAVPCEGKVCGAPCIVCDDQGRCPAIAMRCDGAGQCVGDRADSVVACYHPCAGKVCGATCSTCPAGDPTCIETAEVKGCDALGQCISYGPAAATCYQPCANAACGASCTQCPPGVADCPFPEPSACTADGQCAATPVACP